MIHTGTPDEGSPVHQFPVAGGLPCKFSSVPPTLTEHLSCVWEPWGKSWVYPALVVGETLQMGMCLSQISVNGREVIQPSETIFQCLSWPLTVWPWAGNFTSLSCDFLTSIVRKWGKWYLTPEAIVRRVSFMGHRLSFRLTHLCQGLAFQCHLCLLRLRGHFWPLLHSQQHSRFFVLFCFVLFFASALFSAPCCRRLCLAVVSQERFL